MKVIGIGDTHGRTDWKDIVNKNNDATVIVFIGDYFDTHDGVSSQQQLENFRDIIAFKKANPKQVILLTGNHDFHYMPGIDENYSGFQWGAAIAIGQELKKALDEDLLQMCWLYHNYFFSHAGLTKTWSNNHLGTETPSGETMVQGINDLFKFQPRKFKFQMGERFSQTGDDKTQPPIWVRPTSLIKDMVEGIICVVGHTPVERIVIDGKYPVICIDCLGNTKKEYLIIEDGKPRIGII